MGLKGARGHTPALDGRGQCASCANKKLIVGVQWERLGNRRRTRRASKPFTEISIAAETGRPHDRL
jgi:hypothetical protein